MAASTRPQPTAAMKLIIIRLLQIKDHRERNRAHDQSYRQGNDGAPDHSATPAIITATMHAQTATPNAHMAPTSVFARTMVQTAATIRTTSQAPIGKAIK